MARHKLNKDKQKHIRERIADMMREAEPTPFVMEGPCRAGIRSSLCLQGWPWVQADQVAAQIVTAALNSIGARRPNWYEGQPEWTQPGAVPLEYDRCRRCHGPIPDNRRMFCCYECKQWFHAERGRQARSEEIRAYQRAWYVTRKRKQHETI